MTNLQSLEVLIMLTNNPNGIEIEKFLDKGLKIMAEYLFEEDYLKKIKIQQNNPKLGYRLTDSGDKLVNNLLEYYSFLLSNKR